MTSKLTELFNIAVVHAADTLYELSLGGGQSAIIEIADYDLVNGFSWKLLGNGYVAASHRNLFIYLHRLIAGAGATETVDHINGNPLDNRSVNLRICTRSQNSANRGADRRRLGTSSIHKGVSWSKTKRRWVAYLHFNSKTRYLGCFTEEEDAARAYNKAALETWGSFARLNEVGDTS